MVDGRRARGEQRRDELMAAGVKLVSREGAAGVTHRAVAQEAGCSLASVTYHFPTVSALKQSIFMWAGNRALDEMAAEAGGSAGDGADAATVAGDYAYRLCAGESDLGNVLLRLLVAASVDPDLRPIVTRLNEDAGQILSGVVRPEEAAAVVAAIQGIMLVAAAYGTERADWARDSVRLTVGRFAVDHPTAHREQNGTSTNHIAID